LLLHACWLLPNSLLQKWTWWNGDFDFNDRHLHLLTIFFSIIREATARSKDGRISQSDFLDYSASSSRYSLFTPMEASIVFHFAGRGNGSQRLALLDFAQLLDPRWTPPHQELEQKTTTSTSFLNSVLHSTYSFVQGGLCTFSINGELSISCSLQVSLEPSERLLYIPLIWVSNKTAISFVSRLMW
jgi:hypothetical protein